MVFFAPAIVMIASSYWNTNAHQFFTISATPAAAAAAAPAIDIGSSSGQQVLQRQQQQVLQLFADRQEMAEDEQDLVLHRTCYFFDTDPQQKKRMSTARTRDALAALWTASAKKGEEVIVVSMQQLYVAFWPALCLAGMVYILLQFVVFYRGTGNGIGGISWTGDAMTKHSAMLLSCVYAALAWTLSNGLVLNPRKNLA